jgi:alkylation response protein AidB-like acyl-CoA dehydrogenase
MGPGPGKARRVEGGYRVTANWSFASGSHNATWLGAHVPVHDEHDRPLANPDGGPVIRTALFPRSAAAMTDIWHVIGLRGTGSDQFGVEDLFVPEGYMAWRDEGERREPGLLYRFSSLQLYAAGFASVALGVGRASLDALIELARDKVPWRAAGTLRQNNVVQSEVAQAEAKLSAARAWLHRLLAEVTAAVARDGRLNLDQRMRIRLASTFAIHEALKVADFAYTAAGSTAIFENEAFERRFRDIHTVSQQLQGRRSHFETVGAYLMGLDGDTSWL